MSIDSANYDAYPEFWPGADMASSGGAGGLPGGGVLGDILYYDGTAWVTLPIGVVGTYLTVVGGIPSWGPAPVGAVPAGAMTGDMLVWNNGLGGWVILPIAPSVAGQVLTSNGPGFAATWQASASLPAGVQGDVLYHNGVAWVVLNAGAVGQFLQTQGAGANPLWANAAAGLVGVTHGDIQYWNGVAWTILAPGLNGQILQTQAAGAAPQWVTSELLPPGTIHGQILFWDGADWVLLDPIVPAGPNRLESQGAGADPHWVPLPDADLFGSTAIPAGATSLVVPLVPAMPAATYLVVASVSNTVTPVPAHVTAMVTAKTVNNFTVRLSGPTPDANYVLEWHAVQP